MCLKKTIPQFGGSINALIQFMSLMKVIDERCNLISGLEGQILTMFGT